MLEAIDLSEYLDRVATCDSRPELDDLLISAFERIGAAAISGYEFPYGGSVSTKALPIISTWPEEIQQMYRGEMAGNDPIMYAAMTMGTPVHFLDIEQSLAISTKTGQVLDAMRSFGFNDGVTTPVFAKPGAFAYFVAAFKDERPDITLADMRRIKFLFSEYYYRYRELVRVRATTLSQRERQVLVAIVNDKSNAEIAALLGVSENTVGTYVRRCFEKLDVNSRTQAVLRYLGGGALDLAG
ncbi:LuxR C-terminal-related transcriptional regulator [Henriciella sp. AS95]|uniref:helix-turn-helix transcriptional regulator n=1 Tax=Henriciella sp. AS95 TaxID=3135782 RepID=UPI00317D6962